MDTSKQPIMPINGAGTCKRCGSENCISFTTLGENLHYIACYSCGAQTGFYSTEAKAVQAWNEGILLNRAQKRRLRHG